MAFRFTMSSPPNSTLILLNYGLHVHPNLDFILSINFIACLAQLSSPSCISDFVWLPLASASPWLPNHSPKLNIKVYSKTSYRLFSKFTSLWPWTLSPNSVFYNLEVHTIITSMCSSKLAGICHPTAFLSSLIYCFQDYLVACLIKASNLNINIYNRIICWCYSDSGNLSILVYLWVYLIMVSRIISNYTWSQSICSLLCLLNCHLLVFFLLYITADYHKNHCLYLYRWQ